jgi:hypothetical protein
LKPKDTFIGTDFIKVPIVNGKGKGNINGLDLALPVGSKLPAGTYDVQVKFYPKWAENEAVASEAGIKNPIQGKAIIKLDGSGASAASAKARAEGQRWVILNVSSGMAWEPHFWKKKFGTWQEVENRGEGNPKILKLYYFKSVDMTLLVNVLKGEIVTYRQGLSHQ